MYNAELLKDEDVRAHICTIFFVENLRKICFFERKTGEKKMHFFMIVAPFDNLFQNFMCFHLILGLFLCAKLSYIKFGCAKEFEF